MQRILADLDHVRYIHIHNGKPQSRGEGCIVEVFADPQQSTLVANNSIYLNVHSFDYLELKQGVKAETYFDLIQENRVLRLIPLTSPLKDKIGQTPNSASLEDALAQLIAAKLDAQEVDENGNRPEGWELDW
jgi:hypothetical protein